MSQGLKVYPVGLVGEQHYQKTIQRCRENDRVRIVHEPDNKFDDKALAVRTASDETIGYIARDSWLREVILDQSKKTWASIVSIKPGGSGALDVVLGVAVVPDDAADWVPGPPNPAVNPPAESVASGPTANRLGSGEMIGLALLLLICILAAAKYL